MTSEGFTGSDRLRTTEFFPYKLVLPMNFGPRLCRRPAAARLTLPMRVPRTLELPMNQMFMGAMREEIRRGLINTPLQRGDCVEPRPASLLLLRTCTGTFNRGRLLPLLHWRRGLG